MSKLSSILIPSGKFVTVTFIKADGTIRKLNGRTGVKKYLKGSLVHGNMSTPDDGKYFKIWTRNNSIKFDACRNINKSTIMEVKANGIVVYKNHNFI